MIADNESNTVLIVDDDRLMRLGMRKLLTKAGYRVVGTAADGIEAVRKAENLQPNIILMDLVMPRVHGVSAIEKIAHLVPRSNIIILTGLYTKSILNEALEAGAKDYIFKPFEISDLLTMIQKNCN